MNKIDQVKLVTAIVEFEDGKAVDYMGYYSRKRIIEQKEDTNEQNILLNYPVVYVHTWNLGGKRKIYVGETIDAVRRANEHNKTGTSYSNVRKKWQEDWISKDSTDRKSFYFGGLFMNKSMALDIEQSLMDMFGDRIEVDYEKEIYGTIAEEYKIVNGRDNRQNNYSNKKYRNIVLEQIWTFLRENYDSNLKESIDYSKFNQNTLCYDKLFDGLVHYFGKTKASVNEICADINRLLDKEKLPLLLEYPVIYMHLWFESDGLKVYIGEANNFLNRTEQHLSNMNLNYEDDWHNQWREAVSKGKAWMIVLGHRDFNKSMTLDIENRLIQYTVFHQYSVNGRTNEQNNYDNRKKTFSIFSEIIRYLSNSQEFNGYFKTLDQVKRESIFMASPFLELTDGQEKAKHDILEVVEESFRNDKSEHTLLIVQGGAGTGKTVLASSLFFSMIEKKIKCNFLVNNSELLNAYISQQNTWKLSQSEKTGNLFYKAQNYLNCLENKKINRPDVVLVDEAHLLAIQGVQGGIPKDQLSRVVASAKVTIFMFDPRQFVFKGRNVVFNWNDANDSDKADLSCNDDLKYIKANTRCELNWNDVGGIYKAYLSSYTGLENIEVKTYNLSEQLRMTCSNDTINWIQSLTNEGKEIKRLKATNYIYNKCYKAHFVLDENKYEIGIFETYTGLVNAIADKKREEKKPSCLLATYNWKYKNMVLGMLPWHKTGTSNSTKNNIWTLNNSEEVGSIHDIQGFDLMYAGVILGTSIKYSPQSKPLYIYSTEGGKRERVPLSGIQIYQENHINISKDTNRKEAHEIITNEIGVLLSRGIKGLYIYAEDEELRKALINAVKPVDNTNQNDNYIKRVLD